MNSYTYVLFPLKVNLGFRSLPRHQRFISIHQNTNYITKESTLFKTSSIHCITTILIWFTEKRRWKWLTKLQKYVILFKLRITLLKCIINKQDQNPYPRLPLGRLGAHNDFCSHCCHQYIAPGCYPITPNFDMVENTHVIH